VRKLVSGYNGGMELLFNDPQIERLSPSNTRLLDLLAHPYPDGKRLRVTLQVTPFLQRPYLELTLISPSGDLVAAASIVEPMTWAIELTLHLRPSAPVSVEVQDQNNSVAYTLKAVLSYPDLGEIDHREINVMMPPA
jgi:hypothetical protein